MKLQFHFYVNIEKRILIDSAGDPLGGDQLMEFFREEKGVLCLQCVDDDGSPVAFDAADEFEFGATRDFDHTTPPELQSDNTTFNVSGDWADVDIATGKISCQYDTNNAAFEALWSGGDERLDAGMYLKLINATDGNVTLFDYPCYFRNIRVPGA